MVVDSTSASLVSVVSLIVLLWMGCGENASESIDREKRPGVSLPSLVEAGIDRPPGTETLEVLDRLPSPLRIEKEPQENRHVPNQVDTLRTYYYRGLEFTVYDVAGDPKEIMKDITVVDSTYETEEGLRVGLSRDRVRSVLGPPDRIGGDTHVYRLATPTPNHLHVTFSDNRVSRLEWSFYVD